MNQPAGTPRPEDKLILVVDDEPNVREYLAMLLADAGFEVQTAGDGMEALEKIRARKPDFISLDLLMPKMSGHKLLLELKRNPEFSRIPTLIVTAHAQDELGERDLQEILDNSMMSGPGTYLEKPVEPGSYVRSIKRALGIPEVESATEKVGLKEELQRSLQKASPAELREALAFLKKKKQGGK